jgi:protein-S-isoprenylcysteine O-methyltransferase Ste14
MVGENFRHMKKGIIFTLYVVFFWICLPAILIISSVNLEQNHLPGRFVHPVLQIGGACILLIAIPLLAISIVQFKKFGEKYPISANPPRLIIQKGLFAIWRHPIYLFYTLTLISSTFLWGSKAMTLIVLPAFLLVEAFYILIEERMLLKRFGNSYRFYRRRTRLIIPKFNDFQALFSLLFSKLFSAIRF